MVIYVNKQKEKLFAQVISEFNHGNYYARVKHGSSSTQECFIDTEFICNL